jgi:hypothetical protein
VLQVTLAGIFGALYAAKHAWAQLKGKLLRGSAVKADTRGSAAAVDRSHDAR